MNKMENKIKGFEKSEEDEFGYKEALIAESNDMKVCIYNPRDDKPYCYSGIKKSSISFKKKVESTNEN